MEEKYKSQLAALGKEGHYNELIKVFGKTYADGWAQRLLRSREHPSEKIRV